MQLTVRDVSDLLNVSERTIYRWIKQEAIPAYRIHDQYRFNRAEIWEWATAKRMPVSPEIFKESGEKEDLLPVSLAESLRSGGVHYRVEGQDKEAVLRSVVQVLHLPPEADRAFLLQGLFAREALGSTGVGEGIAIPHVRNPIVLQVPRSIISLCFLEKPIDFGALDGKPVHAIFMLISATVRGHLRTLSRLAFAFKDESLKQLILNHGSREAILQELERVDGQLKDAH